jgi:hypothetical protein
MLGIVVGLFMTLLFASLVVLSINYAIFLWESDKISDLTSRIKPPVVTDPLQQPYANRGFTTRDVGGGVATRVNPLQKLEPQQRGMMGMEVEKTPAWYKVVLQALQNFRYQFWPQLQKWFRDIVQLFQPVHHETEAVKEEEPEIILAEEKRQSEEKAEISQLVEKVINQNQTEVTEHQHQTIQTNAKQSTGGSLHSHSKQAKSDYQDTLQSKKQSVSPQQQAIFEKLENRLLAKLQEIGFRHFDVWLELGKLYEKYEQNEKASEIYTMIMKNSEGIEKDFARDRLIALK